MIRQAIKSILAADSAVQVCGEAAEPNEALRVCGELKPALILLDLSLGKGSGVALAEQLRDSVPGSEVVIVSAQDPQVLTHLETTSGFPCVAKSRLMTDLLPTLKRVARAK
jgi:DNA-binding NarL/FixJ family response regulator